MNNKTLFSQDKKFLELWKLYTKGIKEILHMRYVPHHWYILSDYCLFDKNKPSPTATFTICPFTSPSDIGDYLSRKQFKDIKQLTKVPDCFFYKNVLLFHMDILLSERRTSKWL